MRNLAKSTLLGSLVLGATLITTAACGNVTVTPAPAASSEAGAMMHGNDSSDALESQGIGTMMDSDVMFLEMMIPHHQQAVEMSQLAASHGASPEVQKLADAIASEQGPEIEQMQSWLDDAHAPDMMGGSTMGMAGVLSETEMMKLEAVQGADFDRLYLEGMIGHHEGAITMAQDVIDSGENPTVIALAKKIIAAQTAENAQMKKMLGQ